MRLDYDDCSTRMNVDTMLDQIFPTQDAYREITRDMIVLFQEESERVEGRHELEVSAVVSKLQEQGHNRHTVYKVLREHLVPMGIVRWKKFEGSIQLSTKFGNALLGLVEELRRRARVRRGAGRHVLGRCSGLHRYLLDIRLRMHTDDAEAGVHPVVRHEFGLHHPAVCAHGVSPRPAGTLFRLPVREVLGGRVTVRPRR
ncbi:MAG: hypothetical protein ABEK12_01345 [Candidatus Nanohaloarchaea archaeon]